MGDVNTQGDNSVYIHGKSIKITYEPKPSSDVQKSEPINKKETTRKNIMLKSFKEVIVGILSSVLSGVILHFIKNGSLSSELTTILLALVCVFAFAITGFVLIMPFLCDLISIIRLNKNGQFIEMQSKRNIIQNALSKEPSSERIPGRTYKNIDGKIYEIVSKPCPFCETEPIGTMRLIYNQDSKTYVWVCNEQPSHRQDFDYKKKF